MTSKPVVLIVEDERDLAELYAEWLSGEYEVRVAYDGEMSLDRIDDDVDVVLLDRRMPGISGDELLEEIHDRGFDPRVAMVTAVDPGFDIVEMAFDDYLVKPVSSDDLRETVRRMLSRSAYDEALQEYFALASKKAVLEAERTPAELETHEEYAELEARLDTLGDRLSSSLESFDDDDLHALLRDLDSDASLPPGP